MLSTIFVNSRKLKVEAVELFEHLGKNFSDKQIIIFENDSTDGTDQILRDLQESGRIQLIQHQGLDEYFPKRTQRLAYARNALLSKASAAKVDYFCMADLDGVLGSLSSEFEHGFLSNFLYESVWDAVFPITLPNFYDLYAFRHPQLSDKDFELASNQTPSVLTYQNILEFQVGKFRRIRLEKMRGWLEVDSAFGGMGIYKAKSFSWSNYFGLNGEMEACEHIDFHQKAKMQGARLYINPEFVIGKK
jgi:glycosyltransferase involved in cell wall biosynthesis